MNKTIYLDDTFELLNNKDTYLLLLETLMSLDPSIVKQGSSISVSYLRDIGISEELCSYFEQLYGEEIEDFRRKVCSLKPDQLVIFHNYLKANAQNPKCSELWKCLYS